MVNGIIATQPEESAIAQPINIPVGCDNYELLFEYVCPISGVVVPKGFLYDGASIPRFLWTLTGIRPDGPYRAGATVHDWIYKRAGIVRVRVDGRESEQRLTRSVADRIFRDLLGASGVSTYRRYMAWSGVRLFGGLFWHGDN